MKKKQMIAGALTACMLLSLPLTANAADITATALVGEIIVEGHSETICVNEQNTRVPYLQYNGTTYIPIRTAGEWMGKNVAWDGAAKTVSLSGSTERKFYTTQDDFGKLSVKNGDKLIADLSSDISVTVDGKKQTFRNVKGETVYPLVYQGTTYLPLRNIGELANMEVAWEIDILKKQKIFLRSPMTDAQKAACKTYINTLYQYNQQWEDGQSALRDSETKADVLKNAQATLDTLTGMRDLSRPEVTFLEPSYQRMLEVVIEPNIQALNHCIQDLNDGKSVEDAKSRFLDSSTIKYCHIYIADMQRSYQMNAVITQDGIS